jgi:uncharacterized SAM-binding protein YcdF (DUF218 family)
VNLTRARRWSVIACLLLAIVGLSGWVNREWLLRSVAAALVVEDSALPADVIALTSSNVEACALEAAALYRESVARRVVLGVCSDCAELKGQLLDLGIPYLDNPTLARLILERSGVPAAAISVLPDRVDGTETAVAAISRFVHDNGVSPVLVVTARSHTARTKWLLRRVLPPHSTVLVRSSRFDGFSITHWWRDREQAREVAMEYLRWMNALRLPFRDWVS